MAREHQLKKDICRAVGHEWEEPVYFQGKYIKECKRCEKVTEVQIEISITEDIGLTVYNSRAIYKIDIDE